MFLTQGDGFSLGGHGNHFHVGFDAVVKSEHTRDEDLRTIAHSIHLG